LSSHEIFAKKSLPICYAPIAILKRYLVAADKCTRSAKNLRQSAPSASAAFAGALAFLYSCIFLSSFLALQNFQAIVSTGDVRKESWHDYPVPLGILNI
jgi:hypothetical protein